MKALRHIGLTRAIAFVFYTLLSKLLHWIIFPPARSFIMQLFGAQVGKNSVVMDVEFINLYHHGFSKITIRDNCFIGDGVMLDCRGGIVLGNNVSVSNRVNIVTHINVGYSDHPLQKHYPTREAKVVIHQGAYIGTAATLLPGVTVGHASVVAAGSVVTKNLAAQYMYAGVPAQKIKRLR